jgi:YbgC/YbaW family acyl-CoA thioester hydrolase
MNRDAFRFFEPLRVRWAEVDLQKIVFNGHYLMYLDTAVAGYWRALALPYHDTMEALAGDLYVRKATLEYHASARYDERLEVGMRCQRIGNSSLLFAAAVFRGETALVTGELVYVFADPATQTSRPVPESLRAVLNGFEAGEEVVRFEAIDMGASAADPHGPAGKDVRLEVRVHNRFGVCVANGLLRGEGTAGVVEAVHVHEGVRGTGLGTRVVHELAQAAQARGLNSLQTEVPSSLVGWGLAAGFVPVGEGSGVATGAAAEGLKRVLVRTLG